jgi:glycosyltransferase involved in cell wall biosynthesis
MAASTADFDILRSTCLAGLLLGELFRDHNKVARAYRFQHCADDDHFRYRRRMTSLRELEAGQELHLLALPASAVPDFPACSSWACSTLKLEIVEVWSSRTPLMGSFRKAEVIAFFERWQSFERERQPLIDLRKYEHVVKLPNHGEWLQGRIRDDWRYISAQRDLLTPSVSKAGPRICVVSPHIVIGGSDVATIEIIRRIRSWMPNATLDALFAHFVWSESGSKVGDNFKRLDWISNEVDNVIFADLIQPHLRPAFLQRILSSYDLLHVETSLPAYWNLKEIREQGRRPKIVSHLYCWDYYQGMRVGFPVFAPKYADVVDAFSCQTRLVADYLLTKDVHARKVFWIPYASRFAGTDVPKAKSDVLRVLWIGRWVEQKDPGLLLRVMSQVLGHTRNVHFTVVPFGNCDNDLHFDRVSHRSLRALAARFPSLISIVAGPLDDSQLQHQYAEGDVILSTSAWEGLPFTFYEAMAFGCIPLGTDVSGNRELVRPEVNGLLFSRDDASAMAAGIERLACDAGLRAHLQSGVAEVRGAVAREAFADAHMAIFRALLQNEIPAGWYDDYSLDRGHRVADDELSELRKVVAHISARPPESALRSTYSQDEVLALYEKQEQLRTLQSAAIDCLGLDPAILDPRLQVSRSDEFVGRVGGKLAQLLARTPLFRPDRIAILRQAYQTLRRSTGPVDTGRWAVGLVSLGLRRAGRRLSRWSFRAPRS